MTMDSPPRPGRTGRIAVGIGLLAAGAVAGGVLAGTLSASAASGSSPSTTAAPAATGYGAPAAAAPGMAAPGRSDEKLVTGTLEAKLRAAALKAVPGGTVIRIETDAGDGVYEAHMTKADGTTVTVKFDNSGAVTKVENGMGSGDPQLGGGPGH